MNPDNIDHQAFLAYWKSLRRDGEITTSSQDFLDSPHPLFSPNVLVLDVHEDDVIVRLVATAVVERWGVDLTGKSMFDAPIPMKRQDTLTNYNSIINHPCGLLSENSTRTTGGRAVASETLALPLGVVPGRAKRLVTYSLLMEPLTENERSEHVAAYARQNWIDIGRGVPDQAPLLPMLVE